MKALMQPIRDNVRGQARVVARELDRVSRGRLTPDVVTWTGLVMHLPIAYLIATGDFNVLAAVLLVFFGLFDVLDGALAHVQKRASERGMLLDASTDRFKEVLLYTGAAWALARGPQPEMAAWAAAAVGASVCVSYVKAKGEAAVAARQAALPHATLNRMFQDGLLTFEIRMALLVVFLLLNQLALAMILIALAASFTALQRLVLISKALK